MKKVLALILSLFVFASPVIAQGFEKAIGVDMAFTGVTPNFYMFKNHFELESGLSYMQESTFTDIPTVIPSVMIGYSATINRSNTRFAIGLSDQMLLGFTKDVFSPGNVFSIYLRVSKPLDSNMELGGIMFIPLHYFKASTNSSLIINELPSMELLSRGLTMFTFEVRYYLGGL